MRPSSISHARREDRPSKALCERRSLALNMPLRTVSNRDVVLIVVVTPIIAYGLYLYLLPKPLSNIPYDRDAARSLLGDLPALARHGGEAPMEWMINRAVRQFPAALSQVFFSPFGRSSLLLTDFHECNNILLRKKEWDRFLTCIQVNEIRETWLCLRGTVDDTCKIGVGVGVVVGEVLSTISSPESSSSREPCSGASTATISAVLPSNRATDLTPSSNHRE